MSMSKELYFEYLNELRESGEINMFGAGVYLENDFGLSKKEAGDILIEWMKGFDSEEDVAEEDVAEEDVAEEDVDEEDVAEEDVVERMESLPLNTQYPDGNVYANHIKDGFFQVSHTTQKRVYFTEGQSKKFASFDHIEYYLINK